MIDALIHHLMLLLRRIFAAIYAYSFCHAARKAFFLLLRNFLRVSAVSMVSGFVLLIGKVPPPPFQLSSNLSDSISWWSFYLQLLIPISTTFLAYLVISYGTNTNDITGIIAPLVLIYLLAYWIGFMFIEIFAMVKISITILCPCCSVDLSTSIDLLD